MKTVIAPDQSSGAGQSQTYELNQNLSHYILVEKTMGINSFLEKITEYLYEHQISDETSTDSDNKTRVNVKDV